MSVKNTHVSALLHPSQSAWGGVQILVFLKVPRGSSDLPRLTNCRSLGSFQGWFQSWPSAASGRLPPMAGTSGCGRTEAGPGPYPCPISALLCPPRASGTPKKDAWIPRQEQSLADSAGCGSQNCPTHSGLRPPAPGRGGSESESAGGRHGQR